MRLPVVLSPSLLTHLLVGVVFAKLLSTALLVTIGSYREATSSPFRYLLLIVTKVTAPCIPLFAGLLEVSRSHTSLGWSLVALSVPIACVAFYVLRLRRQGRFYGAADHLQKFMSPLQVKVALLAVLGLLAAIFYDTH